MPKLSPPAALSLRLRRAMNEGRSLRWRPESRAQILARLLVKRAEARQAGLDGLEASLRRQIAWALPMQRAGGPAPEGVDGRDEAATAFHDRL